MGGHNAAAAAQQTATPEPAKKKTKGGYYGVDPNSMMASNTNTLGTTDTARRGVFLGG